MHVMGRIKTRTQRGDARAGKQNDERQAQCARAGRQKKPIQHPKKQRRWGRRMAGRIMPTGDGGYMILGSQIPFFFFFFFWKTLYSR